MADLSDLLNGLRVRAPWLSAGRPALKRAGFVISRGYDNTIRNALLASYDQDDIDALRLGLIEHLVAGQKRFHLLKLRPRELQILRDWAAGKRKTTNDLTDAFPGVASNANIRVHMNGGLYSMGSCDLLQGTAALFTSARSYVQRVDVPTSQLKPTAADGYERLVGYQRNYLQAYDAIWLPEKGNVACIALDAPLGTPAEFPNNAYLALMFQIRQRLGRTPESVNLWPAIDSLYRSQEGKLVDYGFVVDGKQVNHHKARRNTDDLRTALYDSAGSAAVGDDLLPFKVAIQWAVAGPRGEHSYPELLLPGVAADLNRANPVVDHAFLRDGLTTEDLAFVVSKLLIHLP